MAGELPSKGLGDSLVTLLKGDEVFAQNLKVGEVVGGEHLALNYREVDLDLALSQEAWVGRWMRRRWELRKAVRSSSGEVIARASDLSKTGQRVLIKTAAANNPLLEEALPARLDLMREEIGGVDPTPLESLLTEQIVSLWMLLQLHEVLHSATYKRGSEHRVPPSFLLQMVKMQESAHRSFLASVQTLARIRKLQANTPGIQVNTQINLR